MGLCYTTRYLLDIHLKFPRRLIEAPATNVFLPSLLRLILLQIDIGHRTLLLLSFVSPK
jgi:hypothetical protein